MKTDRNHKDQGGTLEKYLSGEMNEAESSAFKAAISASPDTRKAWKKLHDRLQDEHLITAIPVAETNRFLRPVFTIAAAAMILLGIGIVAYLNMRSEPSGEMVYLNTGNVANTLIKTLTDGSVIYIAGNSSFSFPEEFKSGSRNVTLKGEAFFDIAPNPSKPFIIETDEALVQVLGTAFNVRTQNGHGFELFVDRGKVKVTLKTNPANSEMVIAGEKISAINSSLVKSKQNPGLANSWYKQHMHFKDETLQHIISVLNRNFNTTFVLAGNDIGKHKMTVTFHDETPETMTELICLTLNLKSQNINGEVVLFENKESRKQH